MIKFGSNNIGKVYLGSSPIGKAYLGSNLVYQKGGSPMPPSPVSVQYLQAPAAGGAYIDTGIQPTNNTRVIVEASEISNTSSFIFGARVALSNSMFYMQAGANSGNDGFWCGYRNQSLFLQGYQTTNHSYGIMGDLKKVYVDSSAVLTFTDNTSISCPYNIYIFGMNNGGVLSPGSGFKIHSFSIWDGGTKIANFHPYRIGNVACMYNDLNDTFYYNQGTESLICGPDYQQ